jgi:uncharacterized protein YdhG (YjbR/CyaY superfamily)
MSKNEVENYLAALPPDARKVIEKVRATVRKSLPKGYVEHVGYRMLCYSVPLETYPDTYNDQPLCYVALAAQKSYYSLYLTGPYMVPEQREAIEAAFAKAGKTLDMGKSCLRFKTAEDLPMATLGKVIGSIPPAAFIRLYEASRSGRSEGKAK